jgi:hypothetical protein
MDPDGVGLAELDGKQLDVRVAGEAAPMGTPSAVNGTTPILAFAVSESITIEVE